MPTLQLRGVPADLMSRLTAYASRVGLGRAGAAVLLLNAALSTNDQRRAAGRARAAQPSAHAARVAGAHAANAARAAKAGAR